jgi:hypothetical protein
MIEWLAALILAAVPSAEAPSAPPPLSPASLAAMQKVYDAYRDVELHQAALPLAKDDAEKLVRLQDLDQAGREAFDAIDLNALPASDRQIVSTALWGEIGAHDVDDQQALKAMLPAQGWFTISKYGAKASTAAFLVVQHATNDPTLMKLALTRMTPFAATGEVDGENYALLYDRVSVQFLGRPQRYGSQVACKHGQASVMNLEDPAHVDERRKTVGLTQSEADYVALVEPRCRNSL